MQFRPLDPQEKDMSDKMAIAHIIWKISIYQLMLKFLLDLKPFTTILIKK